MKKLSSLSILLLFAAIIFYSGCKDTISGDQLDSRTIPTSNVSYSKDIQPVLNLKCASAGCHNNIDRAANYSLTSYNFTTDPMLIVKGHPESSLLVEVIDPIYAIGSPMPPPAYPQLTQAQITGIETWIKEGADNN